MGEDHPPPDPPPGGAPVTALWVIIALFGIAFIGQGILMCLWSIVEIVRQVIFGTGVVVPEYRTDPPKRQPSVRKQIAKFDNGGN